MVVGLATDILHFDRIVSDDKRQITILTTTHIIQSLQLHKIVLLWDDISAHTTISQNNVPSLWRGIWIGETPF